MQMIFDRKVNESEALSHTTRWHWMQTEGNVVDWILPYLYFAPIFNQGEK